MYAGALFIQTALGWNMYVSIVVLLLVTAVYTVVGRFNSEKIQFQFCQGRCCVKSAERFILLPNLIADYKPPTSTSLIIYQF